MKALLTGITGQDGSYLTESLIRDGWSVVGMVRRTSEFQRGRIDQLRETHGGKLRLFYGDLGDISQLRREIVNEAPDVIYHLAGQSHVGISFRIPKTTLLELANSTLSLLEICRDLPKSPKLLLIGSSEVFGDPEDFPQNELSAHRPTSPYGCAKSCAMQLGSVYRDSFGVPVTTIIPYNHESVRRGANFVTRKITSTAARISRGSDEVLELGNIDGARDWGYAPEYVEGMRLAMESGPPGDYILATGQLATVRAFAEKAFESAGIPIEFEGDGLNEVGRLIGSGRVCLRINPEFFRPADPSKLVGDPAKAKEKLSWAASLKGVEVASKMIEGEFELLEGK